MRALLTPRWIAAGLVVVVLSVVFANLGLWQLRRLDERRLENTIGASRFQDAPLEIERSLPSMEAATSTPFSGVGPWPPACSNPKTRC